LLKKAGESGDHHEAFGWLMKAAEQKDVSAERDIGALLNHGHCMPIDAVGSYVWLKRAATAGDKLAGDRLQALAAAMTPQERAEADRRLGQDTNQTSAHRDLELRKER